MNFRLNLIGLGGLFVSVFTTTGSNKIHTRECSMCHVGQVKVEYYGSWDQFTETMETCKECGWSPDECEGC